MKKIILFSGLLFLSLGVFAQALIYQYAPEPSIPPSNAIQGVANCHELSVSFDQGNGARRLIVMRAGAPVDQLPIDGLEYNADSKFGKGADLGNGNFVVYKGIGDFALITGLKENTDYHYAIFEFNGSGTNTNYLTSIYLSLNKYLPLDPVVDVATQDVRCHGESNGSIDLQISNGTEPYRVIWNTGLESEDLQNLAAGSYSYTMTDSVGCLKMDQIEVSEPSELLVSIDKSDVQCPGGSDGELRATVTGGTLPYSIKWSTGSTDYTINNLEAGNYSISVSDAHSCTAEESVHINQPAEIIIETYSQDANCHGEANGLLELYPAGGTPPYQIVWSNGATGSRVEDLPGGTYQYTITDAHSCTFEGMLEVGEPDPIELQANIYDVSCFGYSDGAAAIEIWGGTAPYGLHWNDGSNAKNRQELTAGYYRVTAIDERGCRDSLSFEIMEPDSLELQLATRDVTCAQKADGNIEVEVSGGTTPYTYLWNDGFNGKDREYLPAGPYSLTVSDANGCSASSSAKVDVVAQSLQECEVSVNIYDVITPNGDGNNDVWIVEDIREYPDNEVEIYNRWGLLVYRQGGYQNDWTGLDMEGRELPSGTYYYVLKIYSGIPVTYTGPITFLR